MHMEFNHKNICFSISAASYPQVTPSTSRPSILSWVGFKLQPLFELLRGSFRYLCSMKFKFLSCTLVWQVPFLLCTGESLTEVQPSVPPVLLEYCRGAGSLIWLTKIKQPILILHSMATKSHSGPAFKMLSINTLH